MNIVEENAELFANGEFKAMIGENTYKPIVGCRVRHGNYEWQLGYPQEGMVWRSVERCTLIARPIEDMTKQEHRLHAEYHQDYLIRNWGGLPWWQVRKLKSIGVYPFNQNHFDDGTVININSI